MPMGWTWALHIANESVVAFAQSSMRPAPWPVLRERTVGVPPRPEKPAVVVYVDNLISIGVQVGDSL
eukprot:5930516-Lingulodinium_polyedra.AAC.1